MTRAHDQRALAFVALAQGALQVRNAIEDLSRGFSFAQRGQAVGADGIRRTPSTRGVDDRTSTQLNRLARLKRTNHECRFLAACALHFVEALSADGDDPRVQLERACHRRQRGERLQDALNNLACQRQFARGQCRPAGGFEQLAHGVVDVVLPRREQANVSIVEQVGRDLFVGFQQQEGDAAFDQPGRCGEPDGPGAEHGHGQFTIDL